MDHCRRPRAQGGPFHSRHIARATAKPAALRRQPLTAMAVSRGGVRALGSFGRVTIGKRTFTGHAGKVNDLAFSADGNFCWPPRERAWRGGVVESQERPRAS